MYPRSFSGESSSGFNLLLMLAQERPPVQSYLPEMLAYPAVISSGGFVTWRKLRKYMDFLFGSVGSKPYCYCQLMNLSNLFVSLRVAEEKKVLFLNFSLLIGFIMVVGLRPHALVAMEV